MGENAANLEYSGSGQLYNLPASATRHRQGEAK